MMINNEKLIPVEIEEMLAELEIMKQEDEKIDNLQLASNALYHLRNLKLESNKIKEVAEIEKSRIEHWEKEELKKFESDTKYYETMLTEYYKRERELDPKFKLSTPNGAVTSRKQQPKWNYEDEKTMDWLRENNKDLIRIKEEVDKAELKKVYKIHGSNVITEDGEIVEGITIEERDPTITVKVVE